MVAYSVRCILLLVICFKFKTRVTKLLDCIPDSRPRTENENWSAQENQCTEPGYKHMRNIYARSNGRMHQRSLILNHWDERIISLYCLILLKAEKFNYLILVKFYLSSKTKSKTDYLRVSI